MVFDLNRPTETNQAIFESYMGVRKKLREKASTLKHGAAIGLDGNELENHRSLDREQQIKHLAEEFEDYAELSQLKVEEDPAAKYREMAEMLHQLHYAMVAKRLTKAFGADDISTRFEGCEQELRVRIKKSKTKLPDFI